MTMNETIKRLSCQSCGSIDLYYEDGFLICRKCSTKHLITGISSGSNIINLRLLAKRAFEDEDYHKARELYEQVLLQEPDDWRAIFYSGLSLAAISDNKNAYDNSTVFVRCARRAAAHLQEELKRMDDPDALIQKLSDDMQNVFHCLWMKADFYEEDILSGIPDFDDDEQWDAYERARKRADDLQEDAVNAHREWLRIVTEDLGRPMPRVDETIYKLT